MADDSHPKKKKSKKSRRIGAVLSLVVTAALAYVTITLASGNEIAALTRIRDVFSNREPVPVADALYFDVGKKRVFADLDGGIAAAGTLGIQVLDNGGAETLIEPFRMASPAISSAGGRAVAYDIGGTEVRVFNETEVIAALQTQGAIVSAAINQNGWFCLSEMPETGGHKSVVTVYDNRGRGAYRAYSGEGYVLSAVLSSDNKSVAALRLTDAGSEIVFYSLNREDPVGSYELPGGLIFDIRYIGGGNVLAFSTDGLIVVDRNAEGTERYGFEGKRLGSCSADGGFITLHLLDYAVGHSGRLVTLDERGRVLGELDIQREVVSISAKDGRLAVLWGDGLTVYDSELNEMPATGEFTALTGLGRVLARSGGMVLAAGDNAAVTFRTD